MRTASFSSDQQHLEARARRNDYDVLGKDSQRERRRGLHGGVLVSLGLMSVMRRRMRMEKRLLVNWWYH
jgi:hypothetical protein